MPNLANSSIRRDTLDTVTAVSGMIWPSSFRGLSSSASLVMLIVTIPVARSALLTKSTNNASSKRRRTSRKALFLSATGRKKVKIGSAETRRRITQAPEVLSWLIRLRKARPCCLRGLRANGTKTYAKKLIHCLN